MPVLAKEKLTDEQKLANASMELGKESVKPEGEMRVMERLRHEFKVDDARVQGLRDQKLGYGEVSVVLSLAKEMPDGINEANVQKVMAMRQGPPAMGWGKIAKALGQKLGPVVSRVKKMSAEMRKQEKKYRKMKMKDAQKGGKMEKMESHERRERMEKGNRPEMSGRH